MKPAEAYQALGHKNSGHSATVLAYKLVRKPEVQAKIAELRKATSIARQPAGVWIERRNQTNLSYTNPNPIVNINAVIVNRQSLIALP